MLLVERSVSYFPDFIACLYNVFWDNTSAFRIRTLLTEVSVKKRGLHFLTHVLAATLGSLCAGLVVIVVLYVADELSRRPATKAG